MIRYIPISVHDDGVHCGGCMCNQRPSDAARDWCRAFGTYIKRIFINGAVDNVRCPQCIAQAKEINDE